MSGFVLTFCVSVMIKFQALVVFTGDIVANSFVSLSWYHSALLGSRCLLQFPASAIRVAVFLRLHWG